MAANLEYHKGSPCVYTPIFCQEGFCSTCEIYLKKPSPTKSIDRYINKALQEVTTTTQSR